MKILQGHHLTREIFKEEHSTWRWTGRKGARFMDKKKWIKVGLGSLALVASTVAAAVATKLVVDAIVGEEEE